MSQVSEEEDVIDNVNVKGKVNENVNGIMDADQNPPEQAEARLLDFFE